MWNITAKPNRTLHPTIFYFTSSSGFVDIMTVKHEISPLTSSSPKRVSSTKQVKKSASNLTTALESRIRPLAPIGLTAVWFLFLLLLIFLFNNYGNEFRPSPEVVAVFAIVFVGYLIFSGRVAEIGGAGW